MEKLPCHFFVLAVLLLSFSTAGVAADDAFFKDNVPPEGWFWYNLPKPPPKLKPEKPKPKPPPTVAKQPPKKTTPTPTPAAPSGPAPYSAKWLRDNLPKYRDLAIDHPTRQNVLAYLYLQRLSIDKAQRFAEATQVAVTTTPFLDESTRFPTASGGAKIVKDRADTVTDQELRRMSRQFGIWFFYSNAQSCVYCANEASVLQGIHEIYGIQTTAISLDGSAPPGQFASVKMDQGQAAKLGVTTPMGLYLVNPTAKSTVPLSHAMLSRPQILARMLRAANAAGWISDDTYEKTLVVPNNNLLGGPGSQVALSEKQSGADSKLPVSPRQVLQNLGRGSGSVTQQIGGGYAN